MPTNYTERVYTAAELAVIIGGPYLPTAGGQMHGNIDMNGSLLINSGGGGYLDLLSNGGVALTSSAGQNLTLNDNIGGLSLTDSYGASLASSGNGFLLTVPPPGGGFYNAFEVIATGAAYSIMTIQPSFDFGYGGGQCYYYIPDSNHYFFMQAGAPLQVFSSDAIEICAGNNISICPFNQWGAGYVGIAIDIVNTGNAPIYNLDVWDATGSGQTNLGCSQYGNANYMIIDDGGGQWYFYSAAGFLFQNSVSIGNTLSVSGAITTGITASSMVKTNGASTLVNAVAGTDYLAPLGITPYVVKSTSINAKSVANTAIYANASGHNFIPTQVVVRCSAAVAITSGPQAGLGTAAGTSNIAALVTMTALTATTATYIFLLSGASFLFPSGTSMFFNLGTVATGTSQTIVVDVIGYFE